MKTIEAFDFYRLMRRKPKAPAAAAAVAAQLDDGPLRGKEDRK